MQNVNSYPNHFTKHVPNLVRHGIKFNIGFYCCIR